MDARTAASFVLGLGNSRIRTSFWPPIRANATILVGRTSSATSGPAQIWESDPGAASQSTTSETLQPGQSLTETASWDGVANEGPMAGTDVFADYWFAVSVLGAPPIADFGFTSAAPLQYVIGVSGGTTGPNGFRLSAPVNCLRSQRPRPTPAISQ